MVIACSSIAQPLPRLTDGQMSQEELVALWEGYEHKPHPVDFFTLQVKPLSTFDIIKHIKIILAHADAVGAPQLLSYLELLPGLQECVKNKLHYFINRVSGLEATGWNDQNCLIPLLKLASLRSDESNNLMEGMCVSFCYNTELRQIFDELHTWTTNHPHCFLDIDKFVAHISSNKTLTKRKLERCKDLIAQYSFKKYNSSQAITDIESEIKKSEKQRNIKKESIEILLEKGADPNMRVEECRSAETCMTLLEQLLFNNDVDVVEELFFLLYNHGGKITARMQSILKSRAKEDAQFREKLIEHRVFTERDFYGNCAPESTDGLTQQLIDMASRLESAIGRGVIDFEMLPALLAQEARSLKKRAKQHISESEKESVYKPFVMLYDKLVESHPLLSTLREVSRYIRKPTISNLAPSNKIVRFCALWDKNVSRDFFITKKILSQNRNSGIEISETYKRVLNAWHAVQQVKSTLRIFYRPITWIHGTQSIAAYAIKESAAIVPAGMLLDEGNLPWAGEQIGSHKDFNASSLSGERLSRNWDDEYDWQLWVKGSVNKHFNAPSRTVICLTYATRETGYTAAMGFSVPLALKRLHPDNLTRYNHVKNTHCLVFDVMRLRSLGLDKELEPTKKFVQANSEHYPELSEAFTRQVSCTFDNKTVEAIKNSTPFPIVFGSDTISSNTTPELRGIEFLAQGKQKLGSDIQYAFCSGENISQLQQILAGTGVVVFDFDVLHYLELQNMLSGEKIAALQNAPLYVRIGQRLQRDILPLYAALYPNNEILARDMRGGPLHAARVALWSLLLVTDASYSDIDKELLATTAAAYGIERQDEGQDHWNLASGKWVKSYWLSCGMKSEQAEKWSQAIALKDSPEKISDEQRIIHDADCLDIISSFDKNRLHNPLPEKLIVEIAAFIQETEKDRFALERESECLFESLLKRIHSEKYPELAARAAIPAKDFYNHFTLCN